MATTKNLAELIRRKLASDPDLAAAVEAERFNANVGAEIYRARMTTGLTQQQLANRVGMHQSAIARLEDADYDGHSLKTLGRIASALGKRVEITFADPCLDLKRTFFEQFAISTQSWEEGWGSWSPQINTTSPSLRPNGHRLAVA